MEAAHRTALAKGEVGFREKKVAPTLDEFCRNRVRAGAANGFQELEDCVFATPVMRQVELIDAPHKRRHYRSLFFSC